MGACMQTVQTRPFPSLMGVPGYKADNFTCSKEPIISSVFVARLRTGLTMRAGLVMRNRPGY